MFAERVRVFLTALYGHPDYNLRYVLSWARTIREAIRNLEPGWDFNSDGDTPSTSDNDECTDPDYLARQRYEALLPTQRSVFERPPPRRIDYDAINKRYRELELARASADASAPTDYQSHPYAAPALTNTVHTPSTSRPHTNVHPAARASADASAPIDYQSYPYAAPALTTAVRSDTDSDSDSDSDAYTDPDSDSDRNCRRRRRLLPTSHLLYEESEDEDDLFDPTEECED